MTINKLFKWLLMPVLVLVALVAGSCSDEYNLPDGYGYVQFKLHKTAEQAAKTRAAGGDRLDSMSEAYKMQVVLQSDGKTFTQNLLVEAFDDAAAEYGLTSEKLELKAGTYTLIGYYLFNKKEEQIFAGEPDQPQTFAVQDGGLTVQEVGVNALHRGRIQFTLTKDLHELKTRAGSSNKTYLFSSVAYVNVTLRNTYTMKKSEYQNLPVKYKEVYKDSLGKTWTSAIGEIDTLVVADAGNYVIESYTTKNKSKTELGPEQATDDAPIGDTIIVKDNQITKADVPITLHEADANIKDYAALKDIWLALGGEKWSFHGETYPNGTNWNFDKDMDMWGDQPGVVLDDAGRVTAINIGDFNPQGSVPAEIGNLTELTILTLGTHNDLIGGTNPLETVKGKPTTAQLNAIRNDYYNRVLKKDPWEHFSDALKFGAQLKGQLKKSRSNSGIRPKDVQPSVYTNGITALPEEIGKLTKLQQLYIANGKITALPSSLAGLTELRDVEVYNCKDMKAFPKVLGELPNLEALNIAMNPQWTSNEVEGGLAALANNPAGQAIQILYMGHNNLTQLPAACSKMKKLGKLDCSYNKIKTLHPLGTDVVLVQLNMEYNQIESVPDNFCGLDDVETFSFAHNKIKVFPNIFDAKSNYVMSSVDFSYNQIASFEGAGSNGSAGSFKGVNAQSIDLSYNKLTSFPGVILKTNSPVTRLTLAGNQISSFTNDDIKEGKNRYMLQSLDLTYNNLSSFPTDFSAAVFPYFYGIDMSYNRFNKFVWEPLNCSSLTVYSFRYQRDANGNRTMREWPEGVYKHTGLRALYLGGNDIRKIPDTETISYLIYNLDISDNPNIYINLKDVCSYIKAGRFMLFYDKTQNIVGCDALDLD